MVGRKSSYYKQNRAAISRKLRIDTSGKETGVSKGRRFVLWGGITAIIALFVVVGTAGIGSMLAPPNQVVLSSESHAITVYSPNGSKIPFATVSSTTEYTTSSNTTYILTNVTMGEMAHNNVGKLAVNLSANPVLPSTATTPLSKGISPDTTTQPKYNVTFTEQNLTHLVSPNYWGVFVEDSNEAPTYAPPAFLSPKEVNKSVSTTLANGSYYFIGQSSFNNVVDPFNVSFTVAGKALNFTVPFEQLYQVKMNVSGLSGVPTPFAYTGNFVQTNLPPNYAMSPCLSALAFSSPCAYVVRNSDASFSAFANLTNGTYIGEFSVNSTAAALPQTITINGANISINVSFSKGYYITFKESNLPSALHLNWQLNESVNGITESYPVSGLNTTVITLNNGTYGIIGFAHDNATSANYMTAFKDVTVAGKDFTVNLVFENTSYLSVDESGLLSGTSWSFNLNTGQIIGSHTTSLSVLLAQGTYNYTATASGYTTLSGNFSLTANKTLSLTFVHVGTTPPLITATITIGFGTSVSNFVPVISNVTNVSAAMLLIQPYFLTGNQSEHLMIEVNTSAGAGLKYVTFELLGNNGTFSSFGPIGAEDFGYIIGGTVILVLTFVTIPWIAIYRETWIMSEKKVS